MKRITQNDLRAMYAPMPQSVETELRGALSALSAAEKGQTKRKLSVSFALAAVLVLLIAGGVAACVHWDAIRFLYGREKPEMQGMVNNVEQIAQADGVTLHITDVATDGYSFAMAWEMETQEEKLPIYVQMEELTINGQQHYAAIGEGLSCFWLTPEEIFRRGGDLIPLQEAGRVGNTLHVEMTLGLYRPVEEVVFLPAEQYAQAKQLNEQGVWAAAPVSVYPTRQVDDSGNTVYCDLWLREPDAVQGSTRFVSSMIHLAFDVPVTGNGAKHRKLSPEITGIQKIDHEVRVQEVVQTDLGIYAVLDIVWNSNTISPEEAETRYAAYWTEPFTETVTGWELHDAGTLRAEEDGRFHHRRLVSVVGYQRQVLDELPYLLLHINEREDRTTIKEEHSIKVFFADPAEGAVSPVWELKPLVDAYALPEGEVTIVQVGKNIHKQLWGILHLTPKENSMEECLRLAERLNVSLTDPDGNAFGQQLWQEGTYTDIAVCQDGSGGYYLRIGTGVQFQSEMPEQANAAIRLETETGMYLIPFALYSEP